MTEPQLVTEQSKASYDAATKSLNDQFNQLKLKWQEMLEGYEVTTTGQSELIYRNNLLIKQIENNLNFAKELARNI